MDYSRVQLSVPSQVSILWAACFYFIQFAGSWQPLDGVEEILRSMRQYLRFDALAVAHVIQGCAKQSPLEDMPL